MRQRPGGLAKLRGETGLQARGEWGLPVVVASLGRNSQPALLAALLALAVTLLPATAEDRVSARLLWRAPIQVGGDPPVGIPATDGRHLFVISSQVEAFDLHTGRLLWRVPVRQYLPRSLVANRDAVFVAEETVSALDSRTGRTLWEFRPDANAALGRATVDGGTFYFGTSSHRLYALRASDGRQLWVTNLRPNSEYAAVVRGVAVRKGRVYAAGEQWRSRNGNISSGWLIALEAKTGKILWRYETGADAERKGLTSTPVVTSRFVLVSDYLSNAVVAVDRRTGREIWRFQGEPGFVGFPEAPVVAREMVYAASGDTYAYALDLRTGHLLWRTKTPSANEAYALCGRSLLLNYQGLAALDPRTGRITQMLLNGEYEFPTSAFAVAGKRVFVLGPKAVYALVCR